MFKRLKYSKLEKQVFLGTCLLVVLFWTVVMTVDYKPLMLIVLGPEPSSVEAFCGKSENQNRKFCINRKIKKDLQWDEIVKSSSEKQPTVFNLIK